MTARCSERSGSALVALWQCFGSTHGHAKAAGQTGVTAHGQAVMLTLADGRSKVSPIPGGGDETPPPALD